MADEHFRWLDPETAERLLSGEPLEAGHAADRDQADRLAKTLEALTAEPSPISAELPGEAAALAAFRAARTESAERTARAGSAAPPGPPHSSDAGLIRLGIPGHSRRTPCWARRVRLGLAAALAVGMIGGVAAAVGTGVLPTPFDSGEPAPGASVSAPEHPLLSPPPKDALGGENRPDDGAGTQVPDDSRTSGGADPGPGATTGDRSQDRNGGAWRSTLTSACRDLRDGKRLGDDRRRALEGAAGGSARVSKYCKALLGSAENGQGRGKGDSGGSGNGQGEDRDDQGGDGDGDGDGRGHERGHGNGRGHSDGRGHGDPGGNHRTDGAVTGTMSAPQSRAQSAS
ncbi:putative membrane protein [Streptomyces davaonensis JCM 4913]|uniref:Putative membrane protein n=1 Tax=Streptomyces davaonensis (strain DSM 101723 / JCM 4913 / KCC S-0913 / 768) TaxID=1214101 RepID=K4QV34_STRDJ|nr:hypothetical protein [Streptomyces davaonensis]CCK27911.1 putative membrane protein [Streptomyces davaonensis JCM 4913]